VAKNFRAGAHSCVVNPELEDAQPSMSHRYGRTFSRLLARDGEYVMADLLDFAIGSSP